MKNNLLLFAISLLVLAGCASVDKSKIENLTDGKILKLGHAGMGFESLVNPFNPLPPNGITSLMKAMELGADGLEVDLQMTKDGVLILFHDMHLEESTNLTGCVQDVTWEEIEKGRFELGAFYDLFHEDKIFRLDSLLKRFQSMPSHPYLHLDIRAYNPCNPDDTYAMSGIMAENLIALLKTYDVPEDKMLLISTSLKFLNEIKAQESAYPISYEETGEFQKGLEIVEQHDIPTLTIKRKLLTPERVAEAHEKGIQIVTFGGKSRSGTAQIISLSPEAVHTNNIKATVDLLK